MEKSFEGNDSVKIVGGINGETIFEIDRNNLVLNGNVEAKNEAERDKQFLDMVSKSSQEQNENSLEYQFISPYTEYDYKKLQHKLAECQESLQQYIEVNDLLIEILEDAMKKGYAIKNL